MRPRAVTLALLLLLAPGAAAWSGEPEAPHHADLAEQALRELEGPRADELRQHLDAFRQGSLDADRKLPPGYHRYSPGSGDGEALDYIEAATARLHANLTRGPMTSEDARQLGILFHVFVDLTNPLHSGEGAIDAPYHAEYEDAAYHLAAPLPDLDEADTSRANLTRLAVEIARLSARHAPELERELDDGPWNERIGEITNETLRESAPLLAQALANLLDPESQRAGAAPEESRAVPVGTGVTLLAAAAALALAARRRAGR